MLSSFCSLFGEFFDKLRELLDTRFSYSFGLFFVIFPGDFIFCGIEFVEVMQRSSLKGLLKGYVLKGFFYLSFLLSPAKHSLISLHFFQIRLRIDQKFSGLASLRRGHYSFMFHLVNDPGSPGVT